MSITTEREGPELTSSRGGECQPQKSERVVKVIFILFLCSPCFQSLMALEPNLHTILGSKVHVNSAPMGWLCDHYIGRQHHQKKGVLEVLKAKVAVKVHFYGRLSTFVCKAKGTSWSSKSLFNLNQIIWLFAIREHSNYRWLVSKKCTPTLVSLLNFKQNITDFPLVF